MVTEFDCRNDMMLGSGRMPVSEWSDEMYGMLVSRHSHHLDIVVVTVEEQVAADNSPQNQHQLQEETAVEIVVIVKLAVVAPHPRLVPIDENKCCSDSRQYIPMHWIQHYSDRLALIGYYSSAVLADSEPMMMTAMTVSVQPSGSCCYSLSHVMQAADGRIDTVLCKPPQQLKTVL